jgi:hypothetical protein
MLPTTGRIWSHCVELQLKEHDNPAFVDVSEFSILSLGVRDGYTDRQAIPIAEGHAMRGMLH